jgi:hypothetical protein
VDSYVNKEVFPNWNKHEKAWRFEKKKITPEIVVIECFLK